VDSVEDDDADNIFWITDVEVDVAVDFRVEVDFEVVVDVDVRVEVDLNFVLDRFRFISSVATVALLVESVMIVIIFVVVGAEIEVEEN
jgi:hypothetical protein